MEVAGSNPAAPTIESITCRRFHDQLDRIAVDYAKFGQIVAMIAIVGVVFFIVRRLIHWYRFLREFRLGQISAEELKKKLMGAIRYCSWIYRVMLGIPTDSWPFQGQSEWIHASLSGT